MMKKLSVMAIAGLLALPAMASAGGGSGSDAATIESIERQMQEMSKMFNSQINALKDEVAELKSKNQQMSQELSSHAAAPAPVVTAPPEAKPGEGDVWTKYNMKLYGRVKFDVSYDTAQFDYYNDFIGVVKTGPNYKNDSVDFNPRDTRFGFEASHSYEDWDALGRFEMDFYGSNAPGDNGNNLLPRLRLGYVKVTNKPTATSVLVGQDWIPVAQLNPNTVDFGILTAAGNLWWRVPQVTVRKQLGDFELLASAMEHRRTNTNDNNRMPWVLGRVAYNNGILGKGSSIALGAGYQDGYNDHTGGDYHITRDLLALELKLAYGPVTFQMEPWIGKGIGNEFLRYDMDVNPVTHEAIKAIGGFADITYNVTPKLSFTVGYGIDDPDNEDMYGMNLYVDKSAISADDRRFTKNSQSFINTWYRLTDAVKIGAEWIHVETERFSEVNSGNRFTVSTFYEF